MRWFLALLFGGFVAAGCTTEDYDRRDANVPQSEAGVAQDEKNNQADPVCGTRVNPRDAYTEIYDGRTWWFDTDECRRKFHDDPVAYVGTRKDPVCGMAVEQKPAPFKEEYGGKTYYFDSMECWQKFHDNPTAYVTPKGKPAEAEVK